LTGRDDVAYEIVGAEAVSRPSPEDAPREKETAMLKRSILTTVLTVIALTAAGKVAEAGGSPLDKCGAAKLKAAGKGISGEMGCHAKGKAKVPFTTDPNCIMKVQSKTAAAVSKAGGACAGTATSVQTDITSCVNTLLPDVPGPSFDVHLVYADALRQSKRVGAFRDFLVRASKDWRY